MEIATLVLSILNSIALVVVIFLVMRNAQHSIDNTQAMTIGKLENKIDNVGPLLNSNLSLIFKDEMVKILKELGEQSNKDSEKLERFERNISDSVNTKFGALNEQIEKKLNEMNVKVEERLGKGFETTTQTFQDVLIRLTKIDEAQKNIEALSGDVVELKTVLTGNQTRGAYGEFTLECILRNVFGETINLYQLQYVIRQGSSEDTIIRPDAVVFLPEPNKMICIDSKFPYMAYQQLFSGEITEEEKSKCLKELKIAVKKHIQDVANKYIIPGMTSPQALMFIPNDGIFAFIQISFPDLVNEGRAKNVIITSPSTLQPILSTINLLRIQVERSKQIDVITHHLTILQKEFGKFGSEWTNFASSVDTLARKKDTFDSRVNIMNKKFAKIASSETIDSQNVVEIPEDIE